MLISVCLLTGQFSDRSTAALCLSLSFSTSSQSNIMWSIVCSPLLQEHTGLSPILYLNKYDLILPFPVTIVVKFGVTLILIFNQSVIFGKKVFVIEIPPFSPVRVGGSLIRLCSAGWRRKICKGTKLCYLSTVVYQFCVCQSEANVLRESIINF